MLARFMRCLALLLVPLGADAAELIMFTLDDCPYCAAFEREVGVIYPKSEEQRVAPLRRLDWAARERWGGAPVDVAPTFVLVGDDGLEVGRIEGYHDDLSFWWQLGSLLNRVATARR